MIKEAIESLVSKKNLTFEQAAGVMEEIMTEQQSVQPATHKNILVVLKSPPPKGAPQAERDEWHQHAVGVLSAVKATMRPDERVVVLTLGLAHSRAMRQAQDPVVDRLSSDSR